MAAQPCPCGSGETLARCCGPALKGEREPETAEALMRSRYSAFATGNVEHLWRTLHPTHPDRARPKDEVLLELRRACRLQRFRALRVLDTRPPDAHGRARVLFLARIFHAGKDLSFVELSDFLHDGTGWRYVDGVGRAARDVPGDPETLTIEAFSKL